MNFAACYCSMRSLQVSYSSSRYVAISQFSFFKKYRGTIFSNTAHPLYNYVRIHMHACMYKSMYAHNKVRMLSMHYVCTVCICGCTIWIHICTQVPLWLAEAVSTHLLSGSWRALIKSLSFPICSTLLAAQTEQDSAKQSAIS